MAEIKLKVISASGDTLAVSRAGESVSLVHTAPYADGDWIALECDEPGLYCVVQLEDTMPPALVYIKERGMDFPIPPADNRINYNPRSFTGSCHLLRAHLATPEEIAERRNLAFNPYDCHGNHGFLPARLCQRGNPRRGRVCRPQRGGRHLRIKEGLSHVQQPHSGADGGMRTHVACCRIDFELIFEKALW